MSLNGYDEVHDMYNSTDGGIPNPMFSSNARGASEAPMIRRFIPFDIFTRSSVTSTLDLEASYLSSLPVRSYDSTPSPSKVWSEMGLLTILKKLKQKEREVRILILGLDNAGKTTIVKKFNGEDINSISPTLGFSIQTLEHMGYKLNIWDVGGQKSLRSYWRNYFETTDALIWVVDSTDRLRLNDCREPTNIRQTSLKPAQIGEALGLNDIKSHHWCILGCSAVTGENLLEGINWLLKDVSSRIFSADFCVKSETLPSNKFTDCYQTFLKTMTAHLVPGIFHLIEHTYGLHVRKISSEYVQLVGLEVK
ncbi:ADP-ribosylation factor-like protein 2 [Clonorchis sinensis]|uniref:ADP-ribosylation factor-like protein 2 n=1 Tax=Clonorchis sinensis TaxID=79923 RepID=A0A3R7G264_CLOSI|nr:ADP-ribosylation factor-like protein 2 [Clonorchis sinensis]